MAKIKRHRNETGGVPPKQNLLTEIEENVKEIIKQVSVDWHPEVKESIVEFDDSSILWNWFSTTKATNKVTVNDRIYRK